MRTSKMTRTATGSNRQSTVKRMIRKHLPQLSPLSATAFSNLKKICE